MLYQCTIIPIIIIIFESICDPYHHVCFQISSQHLIITYLLTHVFLDSNIVRNISRIIQYFDEILPDENLTFRAEQLRVDLLRLAVDLQQVAQASQLSRSSRSNSVRGRFSAAGQKDAQDFVSVQRQIARGEITRHHPHYNTMPCRIRKPRPNMFRPWLKEENVKVSHVFTVITNLFMTTNHHHNRKHQ